MLVWIQESLFNRANDSGRREESFNNAMKLTNISNLMVLGLALTITAVGCRKNPYDASVIHGQKYGIAGHGPNEDLNAGRPVVQSPRYTDTHPFPPGGGPLGPGHVGWIEDHDTLKMDTIYFDFDKSAIKSGEQAKLAAAVNYLKSNPRAAVRVEGNCDERGTEEYNRSLGERRALAAREFLVRAGINPNRVDTVSYGEDHPAQPGHNEAAWSKNRRDDFTVLTPPR
jgi:peptidoglycan-associated lipoprotein